MAVEIGWSMAEKKFISDTFSKYYLILASLGIGDKFVWIIKMFAPLTNYLNHSGLGHALLSWALPRILITTHREHQQKH